MIKQFYRKVPEDREGKNWYDTLKNDFYLIDAIWIFLSVTTHEHRIENKILRGHCQRFDLEFDSKLSQVVIPESFYRESSNY